MAKMMLCLLCILLLSLCKGHIVAALNEEGLLLLAFKYAVLSDPNSALGDWRAGDMSPCGWNGVICEQVQADSGEPSVISVVLTKARIAGSIPSEIGSLPNLRHLDLSGNEINGTIPSELFKATNMRVLVLANNDITGTLPGGIEAMKKLENLNLSLNALTGNIPASITKLPNLKTLSLKNNYFTGPVPRGFGSLTSIVGLDLSSNLLNGTIPGDLGRRLYTLNLSGNRLSGTIPLSLGKLPNNASVDLSNNNLTGPIPRVGVLKSLKSESFEGNPDLCGHPLAKICSIPSSLSDPPNNNSALAAMPVVNKGKGMNKSTIAAIVVSDLAGIGIVCAVFVYRYLSNKANKQVDDNSNSPNPMASRLEENAEHSSDSSGRVVGWFCLKKVDESSSSGSEIGDQLQQGQEQHQQGRLVTLSGDVELELDKLLRASAFILGATGYTIMYKAVLEDGLIFAVRRLGEGGLERFKEFEAEAKSIGRLKHPNLVRLRGFYWSLDEKLLIYDYIPNGSLAHAYYGRSSNSPYYLPWPARIKIAKGIARALIYLHEKKHVHGSIKPSNILLGFDMEAYVADFGLDKLLDTVNVKYSSSTIHLRNFDGVLSGSKRSTSSRESLQTTPDLMSSPVTSKNFVSPYQAPEALKTLKPNNKWDVYSFGIVLLEMLTGKTSNDKDLLTWDQSFLEDKSKALRMVDPALKSEVEGKEEVSICMKIALSCASPSPQKRPSMKEVLQTLDKIPTQISAASLLSSSD